MISFFTLKLTELFTMTNLLAWTFLISAGIAEVVWVYFLKQSHGLTKIIPTILLVIALSISMSLLALAVKIIPISLAYPIWTGIGAVGAVLIGVLFFGEAMDIYRAIFLIMIVVGIVGLKFLS
jgi:quaternary ammonium compound-resistance protein SugE